MAESSGVGWSTQSSVGSSHLDLLAYMSLGQAGLQFLICGQEERAPAHSWQRLSRPFAFACAATFTAAYGKRLHRCHVAERRAADARAAVLAILKNVPFCESVALPYQDERRKDTSTSPDDPISVYQIKKIKKIKKSPK